MTVERADRTDLGQGFIVERTFTDDGVMVDIRHVGVSFQTMPREFLLRVMVEVVSRLLNQRDDARKRLRAALRERGAA